ncbi:hypothetical protein SRABI26_00348 [Arthrobacter sp. Bi26]|uniref:hypothetical protein n=1 Tax=Arthrobacter sp. Bi26 TaxID=2822350 RepID=UPI001D92E12A|nr:hypothetical protein [Arthrobacter sp. Bi26]CAH0136059.1 hypothetical protein SRABI26_00348 [Arthrobacter sp. Bi26]
MRTERFWPAVPEHIWDSIREEITLPTLALKNPHNVLAPRLVTPLSKEASSRPVDKLDSRPLLQPSLAAFADSTV